MALYDPIDITKLTIEQIAAGMRAGRILPLPAPRAEAQFKLTARERKAWADDMAMTHRPNGKAAMGGTR